MNDLFRMNFISGPHSRTCLDLSIICHLSWINSTTNCDVDIYVTPLMRNLIENNVLTDSRLQANYHLFVIHILVLAN